MWIDFPSQREEIDHSFFRFLDKRIPPPLMSSTSTPTRTPRQRTPTAVRHAVWRRYCGDSLNGRCFCCAGDITFEHWHCGHVIADRHGGSPTIENLRPICRGCNLQMRTMNMYDFIRKKGLPERMEIQILDEESLIQVPMEF